MCVSVKVTQRDAEILLVKILVGEIRDQFVIQAIRAAGPRNPVRKLAAASQQRMGLKGLVLVKQMNCIEDGQF